MIFDQAVQIMQEMPEVEERIKFLNQAKKEESMKFDMALGDLKKEKIEKDQMEKLAQFAESGAIGDPVVTGEDSLDSAFSSPQPLTF